MVSFGIRQLCLPAYNLGDQGCFLNLVFGHGMTDIQNAHQGNFRIHLFFFFFQMWCLVSQKCNPQTRNSIVSVPLWSGVSSARGLQAPHGTQHKHHFLILFTSPMSFSRSSGLSSCSFLPRAEQADWAPIREQLKPHIEADTSVQVEVTPSTQ